MENTKRIEKEAKLIVEGELNATACEVKEKKFGLGEVASSHEELHQKVRCWNQDRRFLVNVWLVGFSWSCCCYFTGKVLDVVHLSSRMYENGEEGSISRLDWHCWFENNEPNCLLNHDGSAAVSLQ